VPSDPVELTKQVKAANDIVNVVGSYLALKPAGPVFKALCPFHTDSRPSLDVDPRRQRFRCWACGKHGDVIAFVQEMEKVSFPEARQILANKAGIKLDNDPSPQDQARTRLLGVMRWAEEKYKKCLLDDQLAEAARTYLGGRKLAGKTVRDFGLGFAPLDGDWLVKLAESERVPFDVLVEVGLIAPRQENRGYYDRFRDRVMFPIRDVQGRPVGFGGRIMPESPYASRAPKYYNSAETPLFSKSELLYGLDKARHAGATVGYLAVVEGYTDVMMAHQCGVPQVVATMGTALNARHVAQLRRYAPKVVLVFDNDAGGLTGVDRALELFVSQDVELAVATLPDGLDPCDLLVRPDGPDTFKRILVGATDVLDSFFANRLGQEGAPSVEASRKVLDQVLGVMARSASRRGKANNRQNYNTTSEVKHELIVTRLASRLKLKLETVWTRFGELVKQEREAADEQGSRAAPMVQTSAARTTSPPTEPKKAGPAEACEKQLLQLVLAEPALIPKAAAAISPDQVSHTGLRRILVELYAIQAAGGSPDLDALRERLADRSDLFDAAQKLHFVGETMQDRDQWLGRVLKRLAELRDEAERRKVREQLEAGADADAAADLLRKLQQRRPPTEGSP
jgi:DNA primase